MRTSFSCSQCGGNQIERQRRDGGVGLSILVCAYCQSQVRPSLGAGVLCAETKGRGLCSVTARALCRGCGLPLCDLHDDQRRHYVYGGVEIAQLAPWWTPEEMDAWRGLETLPPMPRAEDEGDPWGVEVGSPVQQALYRVGCLEQELNAVLETCADQVGGDVVETMFIAAVMCRACEADVLEDMSEVTENFRARYFEAAVTGRLAAWRQQAEEALAALKARGAALKQPRASWEPHAEPEARADVNGALRAWRRRLENIRRLMGRTTPPAS